MKLYTAEQIKELDTLAIAQQFANNSYILMQRAGAAVYQKVSEFFPEQKKLIVFCGQGNNGGDGFVVAYLAARAQYDVKVVFLGDCKKLSKASRMAYNELCSLSSISLSFCSLQEIMQSRDEQSIIIDALLGTGLNKAPHGDYKTAIEYINQQDNIISVDMPSGLNPDTGVAYKPTVKATYTVSFIGIKQGLLTNNGPDYSGQLFFDSLGVASEIYEQVDFSSELISEEWVARTFKQKLPRRQKNCHKHQFGHVVIVGGDISMPGAVVMAGQAALRAGAGLVSIVTHSSHSAEVSQHQLELMVLGVSHNALQVADHGEQINTLFAKAKVIVLGPGLGQSAWSETLFKTVMEYLVNNYHYYSAVVIDADGLTLLSSYISKPANLKAVHHIANKLVLTPHPGEAARLMQDSIKINEDRFLAIRELCNKYLATVILKGMGSLINSPYHKIALCNLGNPGMATAGMGDILAGVVAALLANNLDCFTACCLATYLHAKAGDLQAKKNGEVGLVATDLLPEIRELVNYYE